MWLILKIISKGDYNYAVVPNHPKATKNGYVLEHRVVVENDLGRLLKDDEIVHHKNENKKDNRLGNLKITTVDQHNKMHHKGRIYLKLKCPWCSEVFTRKKKHTHMCKKGKLNCTCCSASCRGSLSRDIQVNRVNAEIQRKIKHNVIEEFKLMD